MEMLRSHLNMSPAVIEEFRRIDQLREDARRRSEERLRGADQRIRAAEAKRERRRARNLAILHADK